jgi:hypothetical protein
VIWSDESFTLYPTSGRVYVWRIPKEAYNPECPVPTVKYGGGSVVVCAEISWHSVDLIMTPDGQITGREYMDRLGKQVPPMTQTFLNNDAVFQDVSAPIHTAGTIQSWLEEHEGENLPGQWLRRHKRLRQEKRKHWVHSFFHDNLNSGAYIVSNELNQEPELFK